MSICFQSTIARSTNCLSADLGNDMVLMSVERGFYMALNRMGRDIWQRIAQPCSVDHLCHDLADEYDASIDVIAADVTAFLETLAEVDMIDVAEALVHKSSCCPKRTW